MGIIMNELEGQIMNIKDKIDCIVFMAIDHIFEEAFEAVGDPEEVLGIREDVFMDLIRESIIEEAKRQ